MPECCTAPANVFNAIRDLYNDYDAHVVREFEVARGGGDDGRSNRVIKMRAGMRCVEVDQVPIVLDTRATANTLYAWNTNYVEIHQLDPVASMLGDDPKTGVLEMFRRLADDAKVVLPREQIEGLAARHAGIQPHIKLLGSRGMSDEAVVGAFGQVMWLRRNAFGKYPWTV
jgi:hypothetical protein